MLFPTTFTLFLSSALVWAAPSPTVRDCGNTLTGAELRQAKASFAAHKAALSEAQLKAAAGPIQVFWHVIGKDTTIPGGNIPDSQIAAQITTLNAAYKNASLTFQLAETDRTVDANWFDKATLGSVEQTEMKAALRKGGVLDLNVYTVSFKNDPRNLLGYATWPWDYAAKPQDDGVVIHHASVPGGDLLPFNLGHTLTHEAGHWVGLLHTFEGGCEGGGDEVSDTPPEASSASGCPTGRNTCTADKLDDPIHNFMDYSDDACMTEFTSGQVERLTAQIAAYRT
ncbi:metalloprotease [Coprinellus micaceus]|uniref:Metalloprotease n=1 Tax=Coprinellus micaceus TaxID=71717 RepID=A0A4Y7SBY9_COPMI|nr:metalloprotease [Coprinellus micaceus]